MNSHFDKYLEFNNIESPEQKILIHEKILLITTSTSSINNLIDDFIKIIYSKINKIENYIKVYKSKKSLTEKGKDYIEIINYLIN